ncbi:MAG: hypothetical protein HZB25_09755 [Candidatus Eisenbacteria bacterium]|nr:hypothetical protein [Candidatus Eisenbacteria bacterium]
MRFRRITPVLAALAALALFAAGCGDDVTAPSPDPVPSFSLTDVNPASPTHNQAVTPRQYLGKVSAWYFGHAT